jgi:DNA-binding response OmpR family regulator
MREDRTPTPLSGQESRPLPALRRDRSRARARPSVLFVDADVASAWRLAETIRAHYAVAVVPSAQQAWAALQVQLPTLVVLELDLPDATGPQFLSALHSTPATRHVLLLVVTARRAIGDKIAAFEAGADDYLIKPVTAQTFQTHVEVVMRFRQILGR